MIPVKICGMRLPEQIRAVGAMHPEYMGFIFYKDSSRYVGADFNPAALKTLPASVKKIGVFVNAPAASVIATAQQYTLDGVQLHGAETPETCAQVLAQGLAVIKAFGVGPGFTPAAITAYSSAITHYLFDTASAQHGGTGQVFDWRLLADLTLDKPGFLSGGLRPENLTDALHLSHTLGLGLDMNSGLEITPGHKNLALVADVIPFIHAYSAAN